MIASKTRRPPEPSLWGGEVYSILLDDNNRKPICRLYLDSEANKQMVILNAQREELKCKLASLDDIYLYQDALIASVQTYL